MCATSICATWKCAVLAGHGRWQSQLRAAPAAVLGTHGAEAGGSARTAGLGFIIMKWRGGEVAECFCIRVEEHRTRACEPDVEYFQSRQPALLLLDEATSAIDPATQETQDCLVILPPSSPPSGWPVTG